MDLDAVFFSWKLTSIWTFWIQNQFSTTSGRRDIYETNWFLKQKWFIFKLPCSSPNIPRVAFSCSYWALTEPWQIRTGLRWPWVDLSCPKKLRKNKVGRIFGTPCLLKRANQISSFWQYAPGLLFDQSEWRHVVRGGNILQGLTLEWQFHVVIRWGELMQK